MRIWSRNLILLSFALGAAFLTSCAEKPPSTPAETFKSYVRALKAKDTKSMKLLLSSGTIKMHEQEAKAQGTTVDEIIKRETLFSENQKAIDYRDEKIEGDKATLQVKTGNSWETWPFIKEDGVWKIDKQGYADKMIQDMDDSNRKLDEIINGGKPPGQ